MTLQVSRGALIKLGLGIIVTVTCLYFVLSSVKFDELLRELSRIQPSYILAALASLSIGYALRITRWWVMLSACAAQVPWRSCVSPYLASIALNNVLPFRAGDVIRAFAFPAAIGVSRAQSLATLIFERVLDLAFLLGLLTIGLISLPDAVLPAWLQTAIQFVLGATALALIICFAGHSILSRFLNNLAEKSALGQITPLRSLLSFGSMTLDEIGRLSRGGRFLEIIGLSAGIWVFEAGVFASVLYGLGTDVGAAGAALVTGMATIATLAPSSPGYFGPFHLAAFESCKLLFDNTERAAAIAVLSHAMIWLPMTLAGLISLLFIRKRRWIADPDIQTMEHTHD